MTSPLERVGAAARLGLFAVVLALCLGIGAAVGAALPPLRDAPSESTPLTSDPAHDDPAHDDAGHGS